MPCVLKVLRHRVPTGSFFRCRRIGRCLALLLVIAATAAAAPEAQTPGLPAAADQEPITPVPLPPAADPLSSPSESAFSRIPVYRMTVGSLARPATTCIATVPTAKDYASQETVRYCHSIPSPLFNAALSFRLNWEGNFRTLEAQAESSLENAANLATNANEVLRKLDADPEMVRQFTQAYGHPPDHTSLLDAIATYERSLVTPGSRFDRWLEGDTGALSQEEQNGYRLFRSLGC